jgi:hypothetical protein
VIRILWLAFLPALSADQQDDEVGLGAAGRRQELIGHELEDGDVATQQEWVGATHVR